MKMTHLKKRFISAAWFGVVGIIALGIVSWIMPGPAIQIDYFQVFHTLLMTALAGSLTGFFYCYRILLLPRSSKSLLKVIWIGFLGSLIGFFAGAIAFGLTELYLGEDPSYSVFNRVGLTLLSVPMMMAGILFFAYPLVGFFISIIVTLSALLLYLVVR
jgi:hypothetical protein